MSSAFDEMDAALSAAVNEAFAEPATLLPRRDGGQFGPRAADPDRDPTEVQVIFSESPSIEGISGARRGTEMHGGARLSVSDAEAWISAADAAEIGFSIEKGDMLVFVSRSRSFNVSAAPMITNMGDVRLLLTRESGT